MSVRLKIRIKFRVFGITLGTFSESFRISLLTGGKPDVALTTEEPPAGLPPRLEWRGASVWLW